MPDVARAVGVDVYKRQVDGMVHVSELSWNRIKNPSEVVKVGDEVDVFVLAFDPEKKKISLGYKMCIRDRALQKRILSG